MHKGHYGKYNGNAKWSKVTDSNMGATKRDDEAHMDYLKQDIKYDNKHGHSDENMTADEKHISKLAGDLKYDEKKSSASPMKQTGATKADSTFVKKFHPTFTKGYFNKSLDEINANKKSFPNTPKNNRKIINESIMQGNKVQEKEAIQIAKNKNIDTKLWNAQNKGVQL